MAKTIPMIITNSDILVKDRDTDDFKTFSLPGTPVVANIPFYHHYAAKISETQHYFKEFIKSMYGKKLSKKDRERMIAEYTKQMREAARMLEFEYAAMMRDKIAKLRGEK